MVPLKDIRDRIQNAAVPGVKRVLGAVQLNVALERGQFSGDAYVTLQSRTALPNTLVNRTQQQVKARVAVLQVVRYANSDTGEPQADEIEIRSEAVIQALLGWTPDPAFAPFTYVAGRLLDAEGSNAIWVDEFETDYLMRSAA